MGHLQIFQKSSGGKKTHISGLVRLESFGNELGPFVLPVLMDSSPFNGKTKPMDESVYVPCFSNPIDIQRNQQESIKSAFNNHHLFSVSSNPCDSFSRIPLPKFILHHSGCTIIE